MEGAVIQQIRQMAQAIQTAVIPPYDPRKPGAYVMVPEGYEIQYPEAPDNPARIVQTVALEDAQGFSSYVKEFARDSTAIFLDDDDRKFTAILDYHKGGHGDAEAEMPEWCDHVATFMARTTPEWETWSGHNQKAFGQVEFAEFIEDNLLDVVEPAGADLLEITRTLEAKKDVAYSSAIKLQNGSVRINYDEQIKGTANTQAGVIEIPQQFTLQIQILRGGSAFRFPARFKYRLKDRSLYLWYEIIRPHKLMESAMEEAVKSIEEGTGLKIRKGVASLPKTN